VVLTNLSFLRAALVCWSTVSASFVLEGVVLSG